MNARFYLPGVGRFASADTIIPNPTNPQAWNRYAYVLNNPIKLVDPSGHRSCSAQEAAKDYETCNQNITPAPTMPNPAALGFNSTNTDPLVLEFYENPHHFELTAGVEYHSSAISGPAYYLTPFIGHGNIPDVPGLSHEGYPVSFSIEDIDGDGVVEWVRYIDVGGQKRILFAAEWQFSGGRAFETFPLTADGLHVSDITLVLTPDFSSPGDLIFRGDMVITSSGATVTFPGGTYIQFETTQVSATTIETFGYLYVDPTGTGGSSALVATVSFRGTYKPNGSSLLPITPIYNTLR